MIIIPAIDIIGGKCVRLAQGDYESCKVYATEPLEVAKGYEAAGLKRLHLVDLDGAKSTGVVNIAVLESICKHTALEVDFSGGIKSDADLEKVFEAGARFACIGSIAQTNVEKATRWLETYGGDRMIVGADVLDLKVCINGWKTITDTTIYELVDNYKGLIRNLMCTDISKDGMLEGPAFELYGELMERYPAVNLIASGGVSGLDDLLTLKKRGIPSVIVGKAIYEKRVTLEQLRGL